LAEGIHPIMPRFQLAPGKSADLMAYLKTLALMCGRGKREEMKVKPKNLAQPRWPIVTLGVSLLCAGQPALAQQAPAAQRGLTFVRVHCAQCHSIDRVGDSPLTIAPAFRTLHLKYPIENLQRPLAEGIIAGHPTMPQFRLDPDQIADVIAYLKTLEP
jgi:mono/diheme cytochrome c family protein